MLIDTSKRDAARARREYEITHGIWKPWFAWHPVKAGHAWVWLERIERKVTWHGSYGGDSYESEYRIPLP